MPKKRTEGAPLKNVFAMRGTEEWKVWLDGLAQKNRAPLAVTLDQALADLAEKLKYRKAPPRV